MGIALSMVQVILILNMRFIAGPGDSHTNAVSD